MEKYLGFNYVSKKHFFRSKRIFSNEISVSVNIVVRSFGRG